MLIGEYQHGIDAKGRVFMPAKFREELGENFLITKGIGKCLFVFSLEEWNRFADKLKLIPTTDISSQTFIRMFFAGACECEPDKQGRILLPQRLRDFCELTEEAVVIGVGSRVEVWSAQNWQKYNEGAYEDYEATLAKLAQLGI
ncbi:MAG: division/cell wall cluster transcriptional repressor MraZ [Eubacteriales bacterium]